MNFTVAQRRKERESTNLSSIRWWKFITL